VIFERVFNFSVIRSSDEWQNVHGDHKIDTFYMLAGTGTGTGIPGTGIPGAEFPGLKNRSGTDKP
jgi:hypothetical protein